MNRSDRHALILRLVREREIATQEELAQALRELGHEVVQTTVSRDIAELGLVKVRGASGRLVYAPAAGMNGNRRQASARRGLQALGARLRVERQYGRPDHAARVRRSRSRRRSTTRTCPNILATLAGENTILVVAREGVPGAELCEELRREFLAGIEIENETRR